MTERPRIRFDKQIREDSSKKPPAGARP